MTTKSKIKVGDRVKLTGKHLKNTGQQRGSAGLSTWVVTAIKGNFITTNEENSPEMCAMFWTAEEMAEDPSLKFRRVHIGNVYKVGTLTTENCP